MIAASGMSDFVAVAGWWGLALIFAVLLLSLAAGFFAKGKDR